MTKPGYQYLLTYQQCEEIYDLTNQFCQRFLPGRENLRTREQMTQAARSAKQCLVEGYEQESLKSYIKLTGVSRGSLKELLEDYKDFARNYQVEIWAKRDKRVKQMLAERTKRKKGDLWILPFTPFDPLNPLYPVNYLLNLVNMTTYLLDRQINSLKEKFVKEGGWTEELFRKRLSYRQKQNGFSLIGFLILIGALILTVAGGVVVWREKATSKPTPTPTPYLESCKPGEEPIYEKGVFVGCQEILPIQFPATPATKLPQTAKNCTNDSDCVLAETRVCQGLCESCGALDYSSADFDASNKGWCQQNQPPQKACPDCDIQRTNRQNLVAKCVNNTCQKIGGTLPSTDSISWEEAKQLIFSGQAKEVYQSHSLLVTLILKNGSRKITTEPQIDLVFDIIKQCGQPCSGIITATE